MPSYYIPTSTFQPTLVIGVESVNSNSWLYKPPCLTRDYKCNNFTYTRLQWPSQYQYEMYACLRYAANSCLMHHAVYSGPAILTFWQGQELRYWAPSFWCLDRCVALLWLLPSTPMFATAGRGPFFCHMERLSLSLQCFTCCVQPWIKSWLTMVQAYPNIYRATCQATEVLHKMCKGGLVDMSNLSQRITAGNDVVSLPRSEPSWSSHFSSSSPLCCMQIMHWCTNKM